MKAQTSSELVQRKCKPCEGGVEAYTDQQAKAQLGQLPEWRLTQEGQRIRRDWEGPDFVRCLQFFHRVGDVAEADGHHPDLHLERYRRVWIEIWTHAIGGLSENDFILAAKIDQLADEFRLTGIRK